MPLDIHSAELKEIVSPVDPPISDDKIQCLNFSKIER